MEKSKLLDRMGWVPYPVIAFAFLGYYLDVFSPEEVKNIIVLVGILALFMLTITIYHYISSVRKPREIDLTQQS